MMKKSPLCLLAKVLVAICVASTAKAQVQDASYYETSELGVDLQSGAFMTSATDLSIGQPANGLSFSRSYTSGLTQAGSMGKGWVHNHEILGIKTGSGATARFSFAVGTDIQSFSVSGGNWVNDRAGGAWLSGATSGNPTLTYYSAEGTKITFSYNGTAGRKCWAGGTSDCHYEATLLVKPNGEEVRYAYENFNGIRRLASVNSSLSWNLSFGYSSGSYQRLTSVLATNTSVSYCPSTYGGQPYCSSQSAGWKKVTFSYSGSQSQRLTTVRDNNNTIVVSYGYDSQDCLITTQKGSSAAADLTNTYTGGKVTSQFVRATYTNDGGGGSYDSNGTWIYSYDGFDTTVTNPQGHSRKANYGSVSTPSTRIKSMRNAVNHFTFFDYDSNNRLIERRLDDGQKTAYTYDSRGNVTEVRQVAKIGSSLADIVIKAGGYAASCTTSNYKSCNRPTWTEDALGNRTDNTYDNAFGGLTSVTAPAQQNGIRPKSYVQYVIKAASLKTSTGSTPQPTAYHVRRTYSCRSLSSCSWDDNDGVTVSLDYASLNILPTSSIVDPETLYLETKTTYDQYGNVETVDGPYSGTADTARFYYDNLNRPIGSIGVDFH